jgi:hypothetical protein
MESYRGALPKKVNIHTCLDLPRYLPQCVSSTVHTKENAQWGYADPNKGLINHRSLIHNDNDLGLRIGDA